MGYVLIVSMHAQVRWRKLHLQTGLTCRHMSIFGRALFMDMCMCVGAHRQDIYVHVLSTLLTWKRHININ